MKLTFNKNNFQRIRFINMISTFEKEIEKMTEEERYHWSEQEWDIITKDPETEVLHIARHTKRGYIVASCLNKKANKVYLIQNVKTEAQTENVSVYIFELTAENITDCTAMAKFIDKNLFTLGEMYKEQILDAPKEFDKFLAEHPEKLPEA